jgi:hypothetical protein
MFGQPPSIGGRGASLAPPESFPPKGPSELPPASTVPPASPPVPDPPVPVAPPAPVELVVDEPVVVDAADEVSVVEPPLPVDPVDPVELPPAPTVDPLVVALVEPVDDPVTPLGPSPAVSSEPHATSVPAAMRMEKTIDEVVFTGTSFFGYFRSFARRCANDRAFDLNL